MCRRLLLAASLVAVAGCKTTVTETFALNMEAAKHFFDNARFGESLKHYKLADQEKPDDFPAILGMACAAAEESHVLFDRVAETAAANKPEPAMRLLKDAEDHAIVAGRAFQRCFDLRPSDHVTNNMYALFLYKRATAQRNVPHPQTPEPPPEYRTDEAKKLWAEAYGQRLKELDAAIRQFLIVFKDDPTGLGTAAHVRKCKAHQAHRYLALALFLRSDWARRDGETARMHLLQFLAYVQDLREFIVKNWKELSDGQKMTKEREMKRLDAELIEIRALIRERLRHLTEYGRRVAEAKEEKGLTLEQREARLNAVGVELTALDALVKEFDKTSMAPPAEVPKK